ncbi:MAG: hypothetical protein SOS98_03285 [Varibaculum sp.]|nr:hypothetical protein [Varibaculum sp.]
MTAGKRSHGMVTRLARVDVERGVNAGDVLGEPGDDLGSADRQSVVSEIETGRTNDARLLENVPPHY